MKTLLIDNYDSFTFNLFQLIGEVNGEEPLVVRNDGVTWDELAGWAFDNVVISPGPGRPERTSDFGVCADVIRLADVPLLGVCLGHQGLGALAGGSVERAPEVVHGRTSAVFHDGAGLFAKIPQGFDAVRYHSLSVASPVPRGLEVTAWTEDGVIMGLRDVERPRFGVQFHPESICTEHGRLLLENFRDVTAAAPTGRRGTRATGEARTVVPTRSVPPPATPPRRLELLVRRIEGPPGAERVFTGLFADDPHAWWLDSSLATEQARFSFMGGSGGPLAFRVAYDVAAGVCTVQRGAATEQRHEQVLDLVQRELDALETHCDVALPFDFDGGFVGYLGYELKADCGGALVHRSPLPDAALVFVDRWIAFDHHDDVAYLLCLADSEGVDEANRWLDDLASTLPGLPSAKPLDLAEDAPHLAAVPTRPRERYLRDVERCREHLADGETYEVCLTNRIEAEADVDALTLHRTLRRLNPAPHAAFLRLDGAAVACSSPERFLRIGPGRLVEARPIKGTAPRGATPAEDSALRDALGRDEKNRAENLMITDLLRNDLGLVCEIGSVHVPELFAVESFETVHQLVSTIRGRLRADLAATDCIRACFPGGSMTGAPKRRTMEIIDELETEARGVYSGAIGYLAIGGTADLNIVIRTVVVADGRVSIGTGGAVVMQSTPEGEYEETLLKARVLLDAVRLAARPATAAPPPTHEPVSASAATSSRT